MGYLGPGSQKGLHEMFSKSYFLLILDPNNSPTLVSPLVLEESLKTFRSWCGLQEANTPPNTPPGGKARTKCITMVKNYYFFVSHLAQLLNPVLNALQKRAPFITKKVRHLALFSIGILKPLLFYFVILEKVMDLVAVYLLAG